MEFFDWCLTEIMAKKSTGDAKEELKKKSRTCSSSLFSLSIFILGLVSASYLATGTLDFGGQFKHIKAAYKRFLPEVHYQNLFVFMDKSFLTLCLLLYVTLERTHFYCTATCRVRWERPC